MTNAAIEKNLRAFLRYLLYSILAMAILNLVQYINNLVQARMMENISNDLRRSYSLSLYEKDLQDPLLRDVGGSISKFTQDTFYITEKGMNTYFIFINGLISIAMSLIAAVCIHWSYIIIFPVTMVMSLIVPKIFSPKFQKESQILAEYRSLFVEQIKDVVGGLSIFKRNNGSLAYGGHMTSASETL